MALQPRDEPVPLLQSLPLPLDNLVLLALGSRPRRPRSVSTEQSTKQVHSDIA
jgi:hypothetical protein